MGKKSNATFPGGGLKAAIVSIALAMVLSGCLFGGDPDRKAVKVKTELLRTESGTASPKRGPAPPRAGASSQGAGPSWSSDLDITTLKVPIKRISLHNASFTQSADLYTCEGSNSECLVEAAGETLQNELDADPVIVEKGEYRYVFVKTCEDSEGGYSSAITATVSLAGQTWHTHPTAVLDSAGPSRPLFIKTHGCGRTYALPQPLRITDSLGSEISFKLYFDTEELGYAALGSRATASAWTPGNCAGDRPLERDTASPPFLCIGYPELSGIVDTAPVSLERYRINGGATLGLFFTGGGTDLPVGGYLRRFYKEGETANPGFGAEQGIRDLRKNEDGTLYLAEFGGGMQGLDGSGFRVYAFQRTGHSGVFSGLADTAGVLATGSYTAVRLAP